MPNKKISELASASTLDGSELIEVVQSGMNVKTTTQDIADLSGGGPASSDHWRGAWAGTTTLPVDADNVGSDTDGDILGGDMWVFTNNVSFGGSFFQAKSIAIALQDSPTTLDHWSILAPQL